MIMDYLISNLMPSLALIQCYYTTRASAARQMLGPRLQEFIAPVTQALVAVSRLLSVGTGKVLDPFNKQILVLLEEQELTKDGVRLVETLGFQAFAEDISDSSQVGHGLLPHGLGDKVPVLL